MGKKYTEEDIRKAYTSGFYGRQDNNFEDLDTLIENYLESLKETPKEVETIPVTYGMIKQTVGWSRFCDVVGGNHYAINEWGHPDDSTIYRITKDQFDKLF